RLLLLRRCRARSGVPGPFAARPRLDATAISASAQGAAASRSTIRNVTGRSVASMLVRVGTRRLTMSASGSILGNAVPRLEDPALLTGAGKYVDDLVETGTLHVAFVRSTVAHADLRSVDVAETLSMPGVVAVYHARGDALDLASLHQFTMMPTAFNRPAFATDKVRCVGEAIAAVVAETRAEAVDAAESVVVDYDELPTVTSPVDALAPDAPLLFPDHGSNIC